MSIMENCQLCFNEVIQENHHPHYTPILNKLCYKYLHFSLTQETLTRKTEDQLNSSFCPNCCQSAMELLDLSEQIDVFQKRISELIFVFSLEILQRRGKIKDVGDILHNPWNENDEISVPANCDSWNSSTVSPYPSPEQSSSSVYVSAKTSVDNLGSLPMCSSLENKTTEDIEIIDIKCENTQDGVFEQVEDFFNGKTKKNSSAPILDKNQPISILGLQHNDLQESDDEIPIVSILPTVASTLSQFSSIETEIDDMDTSKPPYECKICGKAFEQKDVMVTHRKGHTEKKHFKCSLCPKSFIQSVSLQIHCSNEHQDEKPFVCQFCSKRFPMQRLLKRHYRYHSEEKPYKCSICNKSFAQSHDLLRHTRTHTGEKPYQCDQCDYAAIQYAVLKAHQITKHSKFKCRECGTCFNTAPKAKDHYQRVHYALDFTKDCVVVVKSI